jgi:hypothetical protein
MELVDRQRARGLIANARAAASRVLGVQNEVGPTILNGEDVRSLARAVRGLADLGEMLLGEAR